MSEEQIPDWAWAAANLKRNGVRYLEHEDGTYRDYQCGGRVFREDALAAMRAELDYKRGLRLLAAFNAIKSVIPPTLLSDYTIAKAAEAVLDELRGDAS